VVQAFAHPDRRGHGDDASRSAGIIRHQGAGTRDETRQQTVDGRANPDWADCRACRNRRGQAAPDQARQSGCSPYVAARHVHARGRGEVDPCQPDSAADNESGSAIR
jgi:hypothetical protein